MYGCFLFYVCSVRPNTFNTAPFWVQKCALGTNLAPLESPFSAGRTLFGNCQVPLVTHSITGLSFGRLFPILVCSWVPSGCTKGTLEEPKGSKMDLKCAPGDPKGVPLERSWHLLTAKHDQTCIFKIVKNPLVFPSQMPPDSSRWDIWAWFCRSENAVGWIYGMMLR